ncbi:serine hydrolase domain-containing protein [Conexibacter woesei]|uniref:serine hydrolase domain-containing protein n=1 Tax=Conexibacter woesei TaxID=191495 RepID=UPI0004015FCA|nr:serine hydrolase domain-containing protein [Conexibacter woesei]
MATPDVHGFVAPGFEPVRSAFRDNLIERGEQGAAFAAYRDGVPVADLWGGAADDAGTPWREDTLQLVFSGTKGFVALCLLMLADRGVLDLDAPVADVWPEFAAHGKDAVTVAELASHQGRLPRFTTPVGPDDYTDDVRLAGLLADQPPDPDPRAADVYHAFTYGWLCGEVVRRAAGRDVGTFFAEEVAGPLGLDLWIGLPPEHEPRVSTLRYAPAPGWSGGPAGDPAAVAADDLRAGVWANPPVFPPDGIPWNRPDWHRAQIPGAGAIGTARSIARLYACLARGGEMDGVRLLSAATLAAGTAERSRRREPLLDEPVAFGVGFQRNTEREPYGPAPDAFGHGGAGGSCHCAWPSRRVGLSYAMNTLRDDELVDPRAQALMRALYACLEADDG